MFLIEISFIAVYIIVCGFLPLFFLFKTKKFIMNKAGMPGLGFSYSLAALFSYVIAKVIKVNMAASYTNNIAEEAFKIRIDSFLDGLIIIYPVILIGIAIGIFTQNILMDFKKSSN